MAESVVALTDLRVAESSIELSILRVRDEAAAQPLSGALAIEWPATPNTIAAGEPRVACLAPGEWGIFAPGDALLARIESACAGLTHHLADVSAGRRRWLFEGPGARDLLAKGCSLDTDPRVLPVGRCAQTLLAQLPILLVPESRGGEVAFTVVADVSFAAYLRAWMVDAALEFDTRGRP